MSRDTQTEAVRTAGERLEAIENWTQWTAIAAGVCAGFLAILTAAVLYVGYDYLALKSGVREAQATFAREFGKTTPHLPQRQPPAK